MGGALLEGDGRLLPISRSNTAAQKYARAFAAERLCPWAELDAFTREKGIDVDAIDDAAEHFQVSPLLIAAILVKKDRLPPSRLHRLS